MVAVRMVQAAVDDVIDVVAMRYGLVSAAFAVDVAAAIVGMVADIGMGGAHFQNMLVVMALVSVVQMAVVHIVDVVAVADGGMAATGAVDMFVAGMDVASTHGSILSNRRWETGNINPDRTVHPFAENFK